MLVQMKTSVEEWTEISDTKTTCKLLTPKRIEPIIVVSPWTPVNMESALLGKRWRDLLLPCCWANLAILLTSVGWIIFVNKKDKTLQPYIDFFFFCGLTKVTVRNKYPLPLIKSAVEALTLIGLLQGRALIWAEYYYLPGLLRWCFDPSHSGNVSCQLLWCRQGTLL